jgi:hypothetical protein
LPPILQSGAEPHVPVCVCVAACGMGLHAATWVPVPRRRRVVVRVLVPVGCEAACKWIRCCVPEGGAAAHSAGEDVGRDELG